MPQHLHREDSLTSLKSGGGTGGLIEIHDANVLLRVPGAESPHAKQNPGKLDLSILIYLLMP
jgi:hypothetical protein